MRTILMVSGGAEAVPGIRKAKELGLYVVVLDGDAQAPGVALADDFLEISTYDVQGSVRAAKEYDAKVRKIDATISVAADVPLTVASIAEALSLPGIPILSATLSSDKLAMKQRFHEDDIALPWFSPVKSAAHLREIVRQEGLPLVVKPVDSRGSRGVLRLTEGLDPDLAFETARSFSPSGRIMVERFLSGPQVSTESLIVDGISHTVGFADRNYEYLDKYAPHIIENGGQLPTNLGLEARVAVADLIQKAAESIGVRNGVIKGDIVIFRGTPHVIEVATRLSGGYFCTHEIPLSSGVDLVGAAIRQALGDPVAPSALKARFERPVAQRYLFPKPGRVVDIYVPNWIREDKEVAFFELRIRPGDIVPRPIHHPARSGVAITTGPTPKRALEKAEEVISSIRVVTEELSHD